MTTAIQRAWSQIKGSMSQDENEKKRKRGKNSLICRLQEREISVRYLPTVQESTHSLLTTILETGLLKMRKKRKEKGKP